MSRFPSRLFTVPVSAVRRLSRDLVRVSFADPSLTGLAAPAGDGADPVLDAYLKLLIPHPSHAGPVRVDLDADWRTGWFSVSPEERGGWMRTYTLRAARPWTGPAGESGVEIDVDFVLHEDPEHGMGPGARWAASARPGDLLSLIGPDREGSLWTAWNPGAARRLLLCGDETAVPAIGSLLRALPAGCTATALLEVPAGNDELADVLREELGERADDVVLHWLPRGPEEARGVPTLRVLRQTLGLAAPAEEADRRVLVAERRRLRETAEIVWQRAEGTAAEAPDSTAEGSAQDASPDAGPLGVWLAAESSVVRAARRVCVDEAGIPKRSISFMGYWKAGQAES